MAPKRNKIHIAISESNLLWFKKTFGEEASISWYVDLIMSKAKEIHEERPINTMDGVKEAVNLANEEIES